MRKIEEDFKKAWEQRKLGEVAPLRGGFAFKSEEYCDDGIPIVRISNILSDGTVGADFAHYDIIDNDENITLSNEDALLAMSGATTGKVSILHCKNTDKYYQNQRVGYFTRSKEVDYDYISTIVRSQQFVEQLSSVLVAGAQPNVSSKEIDSFEFTFPQKIEEQTKIGILFKQLDNLITLHQRKLERRLFFGCRFFVQGHMLTWCPSTKEQGIAGSEAPRPTGRNPILLRRRGARRRKNKALRGAKHHAQPAEIRFCSKDVVPDDGRTRFFGERSTTFNPPNPNLVPKTWCSTTKNKILQTTLSRY